MSLRTFMLFSSLLLLRSLPAAAQLPHAESDQIRLGGIVVGMDTLPMAFLDEFQVHAVLPRRLAKQREQWNKLRYNVRKVYPYAVTAAEVMKDVDVNLARFRDNKEARKAYLKTVERELKRRWKGELEDLTVSQGVVLVKLIDRQTGKPCYDIIKEMKGGVTATLSQGVALLFSNNLKRQYDPGGADRDIEAIVRDLETDNYYRYQAAAQRR